jgi:anti-anti-sigma factor
MEITVSNQFARVPVTVFHIKGDIDTNTAGQLQEQAEQAIQGGTHYLLLDLSEVPYVSSYGIRAISHIFSLLRDQSAGDDDASLSKGLRDGRYKSPNLKITNPSKPVLNVLSATGMDMFLEIHNNLHEAVTSF